MSSFVKFTGANNRPIYIKLEDVSAVGDPDINMPLQNIPMSNPPIRTQLWTKGGWFYVIESLPEVLAAIEGRDPFPAKVLFGKKE